MNRSLLVLFGAIFVLALASAGQLLLGLPEVAEERVRTFVLVELRLPRLLIGFLVGATLSVVGAAFQTLFRNPLATPSTVGTTAGAALGALLALTLGFRGVGAVPAATVFAFLGALGASALVLSIAQNARARIEEILLAGIAVTLGAGALSQGLHVISDAQTLFAAAQWSLGQLPQVGYDRVILVLVPTLLCAVSVLSQRRSLAALSLGEDWAKSVGVETGRVRMILLVGGCLGVGAAVALCGPIAFVGLLVPHVVRLVLGADQSHHLALSWVGGGAFLVVSDLLARDLLQGRELPVGVLTASLGSPALFFLILRRTPRGHDS